MNKRGQFYLIAAVIFIAVILGFASLVNKISKQEVNFLIDIAKELDIESEKVYDYIIYNEMTTLQRNAQLLQFTEDFSTYSKAENSYYLFGDTSNFVVAGYRKTSPERIYIDILNSEQQFLDLLGGIYNSGEYSTTGENINLTIKGNLYEINLNSEENFYYILSVEGDQNYVVSNIQ